MPIVDLKVLDGNGSGTDSQVIAGIQQAVSLKGTYNIRVINLSLGRPVYESYKLDPLCQAVESAWKAGIVVVVAAGNEGRNNSAGTNGYGTITAPGNDPYVITVGAMKPMGTADRGDDQIASYSSKGPTLYDHIAKPDLVAPGNQTISALASTNALIVSLYPQNAVAMNTYSNNGGSSASSYYFTLSGTSMATPVVSGAASLLLQQNPLLSPDQVKARLMKSAYRTFLRYSSTTDPTTGVHLHMRGRSIRTLYAGLQGTASAQSGSELRFSQRNEPKTFNPLLVEDDASETVRYLTGGVLTRANRQTQQLEPEPAVSWKLSKDGRQITFQLRKAVSFSDGSPCSVNADVS